MMDKHSLLVAYGYIMLMLRNQAEVAETCCESGMAQPMGSNTRKAKRHSKREVPKLQIKIQELSSGSPMHQESGVSGGLLTQRRNKQNELVPVMIKRLDKRQEVSTSSKSQLDVTFGPSGRDLFRNEPYGKTQWTQFMRTPRKKRLDSLKNFCDCVHNEVGAKQTYPANSGRFFAKEISEGRFFYNDFTRVESLAQNLWSGLGKEAVSNILIQCAAQHCPARRSHSP